MSDNNINDNLEEPFSGHNQTLNFEKGWLMFQETDKQVKETDKKIIGGVAGLSIPNEAAEKAIQHGPLVLTQRSENIAVLNTDEFILQNY